MGDQGKRVTARVAALGAVSVKQQQRIAKDKRIGDHAVRLATAIGRRDRAVTEAEQVAAAAIRAMVAEGVPVNEVPEWCGDIVQLADVTRLAKLRLEDPAP